MQADNSRNPKRDENEEPAGRPIPAHPDALLFPAEAAFLLGLSIRTLEAARLNGGGPSYIALGRRAVRYRRRDLEEWIERHRRKSTSDPGA
jgi:predicted DNA-binding transcriptional regulator AlpA